jgi:hypothetical protein
MIPGVGDHGCHTSDVSGPNEKSQMSYRDMSVTLKSTSHVMFEKSSVSYPLPVDKQLEKLVLDLRKRKSCQSLL